MTCVCLRYRSARSRCYRYALGPSHTVHPDPSSSPLTFSDHPPVLFSHILSCSKFILTSSNSFPTSAIGNF
jgi:hypothetical protein